MLSNPWAIGPGGSPVLSDDPVPPAIAAWVRSRFGREPERGFGYMSWVFLGPRAVLRMDPIPGRPDRFRGDAATSGLRLPGVAVPEVLDAGQVDAPARPVAATHLSPSERPRPPRARMSYPRVEATHRGVSRGA